MSCRSKNIKTNEQRNKARQMAMQVVQKDKKDQVLYKLHDKYIIEAVECWEKGGKEGFDPEFFFI